MYLEAFYNEEASVKSFLCTMGLKKTPSSSRRSPHPLVARLLKEHIQNRFSTELVLISIDDF